ncbi:hypothetical protein [Brevundimonas sp.]|uniref:hypothetical protein n=1 Tax=Brevundimonas sp. TaxID=1871086 RepID=UPI002D3AC319|nr:hypothetical protein [Brevundimonas sp.]HYD28316.1 hypothetical protein [Brevundimonas sp.]
MSSFRTFLLAVGVAVLSIAGISWAWTAIGGGAMPVHGFVALSLGVLGTIALAWILMALAFRSDRDGWDERADRSGSADIKKSDES